MVKVLQLHESKDVGMDALGRARSTVHAINKLAEDDPHQRGGARQVATRVGGSPAPTLVPTHTTQNTTHRWSIMA